VKTTEIIYSVCFYLFIHSFFIGWRKQASIDIPLQSINNFESDFSQ